MALATSVDSARVGRGWYTIDSNICVAVITGFPSTLAFWVNCFWTTAILSMGVSTPKSPRAIMIPSAA